MLDTTKKRKPRVQEKSGAGAAAPTKRQKPNGSEKKADKGTEGSNLSANEWCIVFHYVDRNPGLSQHSVVQHFARMTGNNKLIFSQSSLSRACKEPRRSELETRAANAQGAQSKRPRVVTRPDVEQALMLWQRSMEQKKYSVTGQMLITKRQRIEKRLDVPENERLTGRGWLPGFCKMYVIFIC